MKRILATAALTAVISCTMNLMAEPVSPSIARQAAAKFLQTKGVGLKNEAMRAESRVMGHATDGQQTTEASPYYVFNGTDSRGFVVVSGDDCVGDNLILGYSSKGSFEADNIPANMQWWLDATASQISELSQRAVKARSVDLHEDVAPLVTACWNQGENVFNPQNPYNAFCPETDGLLCVTGCMATALSQVLYYHRWPQEQLAAELPAYPTVDIALAERHSDGTGDDSQLYAIRTIDMLGYSFAGLNTEKHIGVDAFAMPANFTEGLAPGHHELVFVNKEAGTSAPWRPVYGPNCYVEVNISDEGLPVDTLFHPLPQLTASSRFIKVDGLKQRGLLQTVSATIVNNSDDDYIGPLLCSVYFVENGKLTGLLHYTNTGLMIEANSKADVTFTPTTPQAGNYVIVLSNTDGDLTDSLLTNIKQTKGYIGHKSFTVEELAFYVQDFQYNERPDEEGNPAYYLDITVANNTPLDYHAALVANLYKRNDEGGYDPLTFPDNAMTYCMIDLQRNNWINAHIRLPEALAPGEYGVDLLIANNFQSLMLRDYFIFAAGPFTVNEPTGISDAPRLNDQGETGNEKWFSLDGRQLGARPSSKGIYIHQGKKQVVM